LLIRADSALTCLAHSPFDRLPVRNKPAPVGLAQTDSCLPQHPTCALSPRLGLLGAADRTDALHLSAAARRMKAYRWRPSRRTGCLCRTRLDSRRILVCRPRMSAGPSSHLSSAFFPFNVFQPRLADLSPRQPASGLHPASAFDCALAVLGATPLRRRLTSFAPATVDGASIMRHRPLSRWRSAIGPTWLRPGPSVVAFSQESLRTGNVPGIGRTLRSVVPARQRSGQSS
jgi:hypothetical protein